MLAIPAPIFRAGRPGFPGCHCVQSRKREWAGGRMISVPALLQAIVDSDGQLLVMDDGQTPHVVTSSGQLVPVADALVPESAREVIDQLLPAHLRQALD